MAMRVVTGSQAICRMSRGSLCCSRHIIISTSTQPTSLPYLATTSVRLYGSCFIGLAGVGLGLPRRPILRNFVFIAEPSSTFQIESVGLHGTLHSGNVSSFLPMRAYAQRRQTCKEWSPRLTVPPHLLLVAHRRRYKFMRGSAQYPAS